MFDNIKECQIVGDLLARLLAREFGVQTAFICVSTEEGPPEEAVEAPTVTETSPPEMRYRRRPGDTALFSRTPRRHLRGQVAFFASMHARRPRGHVGAAGDTYLCLALFRSSLVRPPAASRARRSPRDGTGWLGISVPFLEE